MGLFSDSQPNTLEDVLKQSAGSQTSQVQDQANQNRKRQVSLLAHNGQLMGGTADYPLGDLDTQEGSALSGIQSNLTNALGGIPQEDWLNSQNFNRSYNLASLIGQLNKPNTLDQVLQGIGSIGPTVAMGAALA